MGEFAAYLLRVEHVLIACTVWVVISTLQRMAPDLATNRTWVRMLPVTPILCCSAAVWIPGLVYGSAVERVMLGIVLGSICGHIYKVLRQSVLGHDKRLTDPRPRF